MRNILDLKVRGTYSRCEFCPDPGRPTLWHRSYGSSDEIHYCYEHHGEAVEVTRKPGKEVLDDA